MIELRGGAELLSELEVGQTNIDFCFCPVFTVKDMEDRAAADRGGGVTNDGRMAQLRGARDHGKGGVLLYIYLHAQQHLREGPQRTGSGEAPGGSRRGSRAGGGAGAGGDAAPVSSGRQRRNNCASGGAQGAIRRAFQRAFTCATYRPERMAPKSRSNLRPRLKTPRNQASALTLRNA
jgi:hypothetical protein